MPKLSSWRDFFSALVAAGVLGTFSTFGDWVWARFIPDGAVIPGVVHGVLIFVILALVLGWAAQTQGATKRLLLSLPLVGLVIAAGFYPVAYAVGYIGGLVTAWCAMWVSLALLLGWVRGGHEKFRTGLLRGLIAASLSGLAFYAISGVWTDPVPEPRYWLRLLYWTFAFLPGFAALLLAQREPGRH